MSISLFIVSVALQDFLSKNNRTEIKKWLSENHLPVNQQSLSIWETFHSVTTVTRNSNVYYAYFAVLSFTPGPIVLANVTLLKYCPFADAGLALRIASIIAFTLSASCSSEKEAFPTAT